MSKFYQEAKIYHDGSHYMAIPHTEGKSTKKPQEPEEEALIYENSSCSDGNEATNDEEVILNELNIEFSEDDESAKKAKRTGKTKSQIFNELYEQTLDMTRKQRRTFLMEGMKPYFLDKQKLRLFVDEKIERKYRNLQNRRLRFSRKANLNDFNYFVTFTRDDAIMDEATFKKKLSRCLRNYHTNHDWTYMGVWEISKNDRLHFHAMMNIPDGTMPGQIVEVKDFDIHTHRMQKTTQNTFFNKKFGRTDFELLPNNPHGKAMATRYITKYLGKTQGKIVYSRGLPMYYLSDIDSKDVLTKTQTEYGEKLILHDKFDCYDEGEYLGQMSDETKKLLRKCNS